MAAQPIDFPGAGEVLGGAPAPLVPLGEIILDPAGRAEHEERTRHFLYELAADRETDITLPKKRFRIRSYLNPIEVENVVIEARTRLGAMVAYFEWVHQNENIGEHYNYGNASDSMVDGYTEENAEGMVTRMFDGSEDEVIFDTQDEITIRPPILTATKSAGKR